MLNVCFGDTEQGMLKMALGRERVLCGRLRLGEGTISLEPYDEERRLAWSCRVYPGSTKWRRANERYLQRESARIQTIVEAARAGQDIRVWCASNPGSVCGLCHLMHALRGIEHRVFIVELPDGAGYRKPPQDKSWAEVDDREARACLPLERALTPEERESLADTWVRLVEEDAALRLLVDGRITSVGEDYLDAEILSHVPMDTEISFHRVLAAEIVASQHIVSDSFIISRIEHLIEKGDLVAVGERPLEGSGVKIRRAVKV